MEQIVVGLTQQALYITLLLSAPAMLAALVIGLVISLFQAVTQVQEQTLTFVPKIVAVFVVLAVSGTWMLSVLIRFTLQVFSQIPAVH